MEFYVIFIGMIVIVCIIAGFMYHPIITLLILGAIIGVIMFLISLIPTYRNTDPEKYSDSDEMISRIEKAIAFLAYEDDPFIGVYFRYQHKRAYLVIHFYPTENRSYMNCGYLNDHIPGIWEEKTMNGNMVYYTNDLWSSVDELTTTYHFIEYVKYIREELKKKYPDSLFRDLYEGDEVIHVLCGVISTDMIPKTPAPDSKPNASASSSAKSKTTAAHKPQTSTADSAGIAKAKHSTASKSPSDSTLQNDNLTAQFNALLSSIDAEPSQKPSAKAAPATQSTATHIASTSQNAGLSQKSHTKTAPAASAKKAVPVTKPITITLPEVKLLYNMVRACKSTTSCKRLYVVFEHRNNQNGFGFYNGSEQGSPLIDFLTFPALNNYRLRDFNTIGNMKQLKEYIESNSDSWKANISGEMLIIEL